MFHRYKDRALSVTALGFALSCLQPPAAFQWPVAPDLRQGPKDPDTDRWLAEMPVTPPQDDMVEVAATTFNAGFWIDRTEVTVAAYAACVRGGKCRAPRDIFTGAKDPLCNWGQKDRVNHPINCVGWTEAEALCAAVNKRLPSQDEWALAARGPGEGIYPWGSGSPGDRACWNRAITQPGDTATCPAQAYPAGASRYGVLGMADNVSEWTSTSPDGSPPGTRSVCGGAWNATNPLMLRVDMCQPLQALGKAVEVPDGRGGLAVIPYLFRYAGVGFRCVRPTG